MTQGPRGARVLAAALVAAVAATLLAAVPSAQAESRKGPAHASRHWRDRAKATAAVDAMMRFYDRESGRWQPESPWWQSGNALQALLDYMAKTRSTRYMPQVRHTIEQQRKPLPWWPEGGGEFRADSTDDTGWWALAMVRMYDLTRDRRYLDIAETDERYIRKYWDDTCGGGVWWDIPGKSYKNAISLELYFKLLASLHNRVRGDRAHLARAQRAWRWFERSGMINGADLVNDGLTTQDGGCANNHGTTWTYNQGVVLGGLAELYKATRDRRLLVSARRIADAVIRSPALSPRGVLTEPCEAPGTCNADQASFKGIFARNLAELDAVLPGHPYRGYLRAQAASLYAHGRSGDRYGLSWAGPFDRADISRQDSAVSLLTAVL